MSTNVGLYASGVFSTAFRLITYLFLRIIPAKFCKYLLPALYFGYAFPALFASAPKRVHQVKEKDEKQESTENGSLPVEEVQRSDVIWDLIFGFSSTTLTKRINFAINTLLLIASVNFVLQPVLDPAHDVVFSRVGAVTPDSAKLVVRYPLFIANETEHAIQVLWRKVPDTSLTPAPTAWTDGPVLKLTADLDWTGSTMIRGLWPNTQYEYTLADTNKTLLDFPTTPLRFHTFPDPRIPGGSHFRFLATSCITPNFPYVPFQSRTIKGFDYMAAYLAESSKPKTTSPTPGFVAPVVADAVENTVDDTGLPLATNDSTVANDSTSPVGLTDDIVPEPTPRTEFLLFLGDFIYADVPIYFGDDKEAYRRMYRRNFQSPSFRKVYEQLPIFHTYDDHEIINNYIGMSNDSWPYANASDAFSIYAADANYEARDKGEQYYDFRYGDVAYFVMDTRRHRSGYTVDATVRTMLGDKQLASLYDWLGKVNNTATFKFIVTSVPFTSLWTVDAQIDSWAAYGYEKASLLDALHSVPNVFLISGDRHEFAAIEFNPTAETSHPVYEISTSPLNMFYIPLIRTLKQKSDAFVRRVQSVVVSESDNVDGESILDILKTEEVEVEIPQERVIKYLPIGNHKWSTFEVDTTDPKNPTLKLEVVIDGKPAYHHTFAGTPVKLRSSSYAISAVTDSLKNVFGRVGFSPSSWF